MMFSCCYPWSANLVSLCAVLLPKTRPTEVPKRALSIVRCTHTVVCVTVEVLMENLFCKTLSEDLCLELVVFVSNQRLPVSAVNMTTLARVL